jgi:glycoprotein endo-alpha-1,2-mannosidase
LPIRAIERGQNAEHKRHIPIQLLPCYSQPFAVKSIGKQMKHIRTALCLVAPLLNVLIVLDITLGAPLIAASAEAKHVFMVVMGVSATPQTSGSWRTWQNGNHHPDQQDVEGRRDISSVYYPLVGLYDNADPDYIDYHLQLAKMCGVDGISFYVKHTDGRSLQVLHSYISAMSAYGITGFARIQKDIEPSEFDRLYRMFEPVWYKIKGRPVISFFHMNADLAPINTWKNSYPAHQRPFVLGLVNGTLDKKARGVIDGAHGWAGTSDKNPFHANYPGFARYYDYSDVQAGRQLDIGRVRALLANGSLSWFADGVSPGFDNRGVHGWGKGNIGVDRADGRTYSYRWESALREQFPAIAIPTWDDWGEGSGIEPTVEFGLKYIELTRHYVALYKEVPTPQGDLMTPAWIYKIRKSTKDPSILKSATQASAMIRDGSYVEAERVVKPLAKRLAVDSKRYFE